MRLILVLLLSLSLSFSLGLEDLLRSAEEKNPRLLAQRHRLQSAHLNLQGERQLYYPELFSAYRLNWQLKKQSITIPSFGGFPPIQMVGSKKSYGSFQLGIRQTLYDGGLRASRVEVARSKVRLEEGDLEEAKLEVRLEVIRAFLSLLSASELLQVVKKQKEAVEADLSQREAFYREGLVAVTDLLQARVRLAEVERDLRRVEGEYLIALANLSRLTGFEEERLKNLKPPQVELKRLELQNLIEGALKNRPLLKNLEERLRINTLQRKAELSSFYPRLFLEAAYSHSDQNPNLKPKGFVYLSLGMSLNFQSLAPYYRALALEEERRGFGEDLREVKEGIILKVKTAYEQLRTAEDNLRVAEVSLKFAEEFYRLSLEQYKNQIISGTDLLQAEASLTQARKARVLAYYDLLRAYFELMREVGQL
ncbi:MAG: TolC family protein [Aquificaceae bacterium]|nr:TolC family protein [Aquificaceae bacterium]